MSELNDFFLITWPINLLCIKTWLKHIFVIESTKHCLAILSLPHFLSYQAGYTCPVLANIDTVQVAKEASVEKPGDYIWEIDRLMPRCPSRLPRLIECEAQSYSTIFLSIMISLYWLRTQHKSVSSNISYSIASVYLHIEDKSILFDNFFFFFFFFFLTNDITGMDVHGSD